MSRKSFPSSATGAILQNIERPGYYSDYSTMEQQKKWDEATRTVVTERVGKIPPIRFFSQYEARLLGAVIDRVMPQDDRRESRSIPILSILDERLYENNLSGFRYEDMPSDQEAYKQAITAMQEMAQERFQEPFADLTVHRQELILKSLHDGKPEPDHAIWHQIPLHRFWAMLMEDCVTAYYSHPWAWDEIGFGGPAYPRGYMRLEHGLPEPWEKDERRYEWNAPIDSLSVMEEESAPPDHESLHGRGGSH
jgi:hypothetical protein